MPVPRQMRVEGNPHSLTRKSERVCCQVAGGGLDRLTGQPGSPELLELRGAYGGAAGPHVCDQPLAPDRQTLRRVCRSRPAGVLVYAVTGATAAAQVPEISSRADRDASRSVPWGSPFSAGPRRAR